MSYTIKLTNGNVIAVIPDGTINTTTSMTLIGKNYAGYGQFLDDNFVHLLESGSNGTPPPNPLTGQLWWDSTNLILKVFDGATFKSISSTYAGTTPPANAVVGELWFNTSNDTLNVYTGSVWVIVGPAIIKGTGTQVAVLQDTTGVNHNVVEILVSSNIVGIVSKDPSFTPMVAIPGYVTINPGYNMPTSIGGVPQYFQGTATNALALQGYDPTSFMSAVSDTGTVGNISINNNGGLTTGTAHNFKFFNTQSDGVIENTALNGNIIINLNQGGSQTNVAVFYANGNTNFGNSIFASNIYANFFHGDGGNMSNISYSNIVGGYGNANVASYLSSGTVTSNIQTSAYFIGNGSQLTGVSNYGNSNVTSLLATGIGTNIQTSAYFVGDGSLLTNINASNVIGGYGNSNVSSYLASGTVGTNIQTAAFFIGDGSKLTNINGGNIIPGTGYGNSNVAAYLPVYGGNISTSYVTGNVLQNIITTPGALTLNNGDRCILTTDGHTINLPPNPAVGWQVTIGVGNFVNAVAGASGQSIMGIAQDMTINVANISVTFDFVGGSTGWKIV